MMVNFASVWKSWSLCAKCWSAGIAFNFRTSLRWLFILKFNSVSALPIYCNLHLAHSINLFSTNVETYVETRYLVFTSKMFEKHLWKSDILRKDAGRWPASFLKMSFFHRCFSNILLVKVTTWFIRKWNIGWKWVKYMVHLLLQFTSW